MSSGVRLSWEGKRPANVMTPPRLCVQEEYGRWVKDAGECGRLIQGDNLAIMAALREELAGQINLIYLDPPFFTGIDRQAQVSEGNTPRSLPAYSDDWGGDLGAYLQWLYDRLALARELLAEDGSLYVHLSWHAAHYGKLLLDEIFGAARFQNEIVWCYREAINAKKRWNRKHDTILFYTKGERFTFNYEAVREDYAESHIKKYRLRDEKGAYRLMGRGITGSPLRSRRDLPPEYEARYPELTYRHYLGTGTLPVDYWLIDIENQASRVRTGYPTQKPEALLERILLASSNPGDLVADFCCGSGTTPAVASRLGRRWIGCDSGDLAIHTTRKRLLEVGGEAGFTLEAVEDASAPDAVSSSTTELSETVVVEHDSAEVRLRLSPDAALWVDMWAVQWPGRETKEAESSGQPFRPDWWVARTRRHPDLSEVSPALTLPPGDPVAATAGQAVARVALVSAAGERCLLDIPLSAGKRPLPARKESPSNGLIKNSSPHP